ncbi:uncharacterized protein [Dermacentor andersoni]|uniref:uncharacterized protein isoform X3 n=1 Tax=Dermacentor andersoni TaxID=34620 RepID=UPI003B3AD34F
MQWPVQATRARRKHHAFRKTMLEFLTPPALSHGVRSTTRLVAQLQSTMSRTVMELFTCTWGPAGASITHSPAQAALAWWKHQPYSNMASQSADVLAEWSTEPELPLKVPTGPLVRELKHSPLHEKGSFPIAVFAFERRGDVPVRPRPPRSHPRQHLSFSEALPERPATRPYEPKRGGKTI